MSKIHFIGGEKGGVGKSVLARLLAQYHIDREMPFAAFDTDRSHGALLRFYAEFSTQIALDEVESTDLLMESALETERNVLVDLAAQTASPLHRWIDQADIMGLASEEGIPVVFWHVIDDGADSIVLLENLFDRYGDGADYVVVRNHGRGRNFSAYDASDARTKADEMGAKHMDLPELNASSMRKIDHGGTSLWAAVNNKESGLGLMDRQRVKVWIRRAYQQLDALNDTLLPAAED
ncbi:P-loop NTPase family protein [Imhoffiella purpurea]|uniref:Mobilization protein n=1 Tax=Imhoffiella purpurea TaxID=1249627 RepID=W9V3A5_9GAMM|nr:mobilization protein [Imhoffiella purpurea]EXJ13988.1 hypothetical protein D779_3188 [Imhoffiella purpurea]